MSFHQVTDQWFKQSIKERYSYNFSWMGRPIIQYPTDIVAMQELIWKIQPDLIIETGVAHGGSLVYYASLLELLGGERKVVGIDIDIRAHNREALEDHPMYKRLHLIEGSSVDSPVLDEVKELVSQHSVVLVTLDSNHTHDHVLKELELYSPFVTEGSYLVVFDTCIEDLPEDSFPDRPWEVGDNPKTAVREFLQTSERFTVDHELEERLMITVAPSGYLKCIKS